MCNLLPSTYKQYLIDCGLELLGPLGSGGHATVHLARDLRNQGRIVAVKLLGRGPHQINKYVTREVLNHMTLLHPHIVQLLEVTLAPQHLAIVLEYCPGGTLLDYVRHRVVQDPVLDMRRGLDEAEARWFFQQLILAVDYLHGMKLASRDIKAENILLDRSARPLLKLCDFGYSKHESYHSAPGTRVGTMAYLAPEVVLNNRQYDAKKCDMWSCGVILFIMLTGQLPFDGRLAALRKHTASRPDDAARPPEHPQVPNQTPGGSQVPEAPRVSLETHAGPPQVVPQDPQDPAKVQQAMIQQILDTEYRVPPYVSEGARDLLRRMFARQPHERPCVQDVIKHPWFQEGLPPGALDMKTAASQDRPAGTQAEAEVLAVLVQASMPHALSEAQDEDGLDPEYQEYLACLPPGEPLMFS